MEGISAILQRLQARSTSTERTSPELTDYECEKCQDNGVLPLIDGETFTWTEMIRERMNPYHWVQCTCMETKRIRRLFQSSHITEEFQNVGFKGFQVDGRPECVRLARDTALDYYNEFDNIRRLKQNSILFHGIPGSGKTHLLMAIANGLMRKGVSVQYFPWVEGSNDLKKNMDDLDDKIEAMKRVDVLFIDDLYKGRRNPTDFMLEQLFGVVNYRYLNCKPMMVSSERTREDMLAIDEGIARRIIERAEGHRVMMLLSDEEKARGMELNYSLVR